MKKLLLIILCFCLCGCHMISTDKKAKIKEEYIPKRVISIKKNTVKQISVYINKQKIYGEAYIPKTEKTVPVVILCHGYGGNYRNLSVLADYLMEHQIAAYTFDFRGGSPINKSDGFMRDMSVSTEIEDLQAVIEKIKTLNFIDNSKIYLGGHSQGGLVASLTAAKRNDIKGLFLGAPAYNIPMLCRFSPVPEKGQTISFLKGKIGRRYIIDGRKYLMYRDIMDYRGHVTIFHGSKDTVVPLSYSLQAKKAYSDIKVHIIRNAGHLFTKNMQIQMGEYLIKSIK